MATGTSEQYVQSSGASNANGILRDVNASLGGLDLLNGLNSASSSATSGAVTVGDRILGGNKAKRQFGIVKILVLFAGAAILYKIVKKKG